MITAVGNPVYDLIVTPHVSTGGRVLSGCSTNFALVLAKLGIPVTLIGSAGPDFAEKFEADLKRFGIRYQLLPSKQTGGFSLRYYGDHGERELSLLGEADPIKSFEKAHLRADWIMLGPILQEIDEKLFDWIKKNSSAKIFLDPQGLLRGVREGKIYHESTSQVKKIISQVDVVKPNELETKVLTGIDPRLDPYTPAEEIKSWGPKIVIITLAELGSVIYDGKDFYEIPAFETEAVDATGAGDTYAGGFVSGMTKGYDLEKTGLFASSVASIMVENSGPDFELSWEEALRRTAVLDKLKRQSFQLLKK
ncbi:MAG: PfkB family carbohydrate kinase [candidate division Zixibacteria bacterium]|nr:PfkB family carbohydrate kinase [candidate division Zixibacteria bacterium]MCI0596344.1 PfkB family carbohydrate kinase [candidate division Zixibacteria bacterium]